MKKLVFAVLFCVSAVLAAEKVTPPVKGTEWWDTLDECKNATDFVYYVPRTVAKPPSVRGLFVAGLPKEACIQARLPEIKKDGWVRQEAGTSYYFMMDGKQARPMFMRECANEVLNFAFLESPESVVQMTATDAPPTPAPVINMPSKLEVVLPPLSVEQRIGLSADLRVSGALDLNVRNLTPPPLLPPAKVSHWYTSKPFLIAAGAAATGVAVYFATRGGSSDSDPCSGNKCVGNMFPIVVREPNP